MMIYLMNVVGAKHSKGTSARKVARILEELFWNG